MYERLKDKIKKNSYPISHGRNNHDVGMTVEGIMQAIDEEYIEVRNKINEIGQGFCDSIKCDKECESCDHSSLMRAILKVLDEASKETK